MDFLYLVGVLLLWVVLVKWVFPRCGPPACDGGCRCSNHAHHHSGPTDVVTAPPAPGSNPPSRS